MSTHTLQFNDTHKWSPLFVHTSRTIQIDFLCAGKQGKEEVFLDLALTLRQWKLTASSVRFPRPPAERKMGLAIACQNHVSMPYFPARNLWSRLTSGSTANARRQSLCKASGRGGSGGKQKLRVRETMTGVQPQNIREVCRVFLFQEKGLANKE